MPMTNNGNVFSHVRKAVLVSLGSSRSGLRDISGPECSPGGGIRGRMVWVTEDCNLDCGSRSSLLYCGRRNGCRLDVDDIVSCDIALREGANIRLRGFISGS